MEFPLSVPGFEGRNLTVKAAGLFSGPKIFIDGEPAGKGPKAGQLVLRRNDGSQAIARLRNNIIDPVPTITIDEKPVKVAEPLKWYEWLWAGLPVVLVFVGGLLGGLCGGVAAYANGHILRSGLNGVVKFLVTGAISFVAVVIYLILGIALQLAISGG